MDVGAIVAAHALCIQAGAVIALLAAMTGALARENEALRGEARRLKEAARGRPRLADKAEPPFLATMSHEIRTPLTGILGMADLLSRSGMSPENAGYVEAIRSAGAELIALVDQILDLARMETGRLDLAMDDVDLPRLVEGVVELLAPSARAKGLDIAASIGAATPRFVRADAMRLRQVLLNLVGNAVKFTERGGVRVAVERGEGDALRLAVTDTGPGVPPDRREAIFEDFEQGDGSNARRCEGFGLGLSISRRLVRLMGGTLTLADNPGGGSTFSFTVSAPALAEAGVTAPRATALERRLAAPAGSECPDDVIVDGAPGPAATNRLDRAATEAGAQRIYVLCSPFERRAFGRFDPPQPRRALVADDSDINALIAENALRRLGFEPARAKDGDEAVRLAGSGEPNAPPFDLILMDLRMAGVDGFEAMRRLRLRERDAGARPTAIVAVTADQHAGERQLCGSAHFDALLIKPFAFPDLAATVDRLCRPRRAPPGLLSRAS